MAGYFLLNIVVAVCVCLRAHARVCVCVCVCVRVRARPCVHKKEGRKRDGRREEWREGEGGGWRDEGRDGGGQAGRFNVVWMSHRQRGRGRESVREWVCEVG